MKDIQEHIETRARIMLARSVSFGKSIEKAADVVSSYIIANEPIFVCGNGGSYAEAAHFVAELQVRLRRDRAAFKAVLLGSSGASMTACANDLGANMVFARELEPWSSGLLVVFSTSMHSANVLKAVEVAKSKGMTVIAFCGIGPVPGCVSIHTGVVSAMITQELHLIALHLLVQRVEEILYGEED